MKIYVTANAGERRGYDLDRAIAYLDEMDRLGADPATGAAKIEAALRLLGQPMSMGGVTAVALFPEVRPLTLSDVTRDIYQPGSRWGPGKHGRRS